MRRTAVRAGLSALAGTALLAGVVALAGCSGSSGGSAADSAGGPAVVASAAAAGGEAARAPQAGTAGGAAAGAAAAKVAVTSPALIRTAELAVRVKSAGAVGRQADAAERIATAAGGAVYADDRTAGRHATARLTLKVPPAALAATLDRLARLGVLTSQTSSTEDVTTQVADVGSRVSSAEAGLARLRTLYERATKISDVIEIENEITAREADLESLQAQQRVLAGQTDLATVHLTLSVRPVAAVAKPAHTGFTGGLEHGWHAFAATVGALVTAFGAVLPFAVVLLAAAALAWWIRRQRRRTVPPATPAPPAAE